MWIGVLRGVWCVVCGCARDMYNTNPEIEITHLLFVFKTPHTWAQCRRVLQPNSVVGLGIFPAVAMINHSCYPNCAVVTAPGGVLEVRTLRSVPKGTELTVSYTNLLAPRATRQHELLTTKEFSCHCLRCDSPDVRTCHACVLYLPCASLVLRGHTISTRNLQPLHWIFLAPLITQKRLVFLLTAVRCVCCRHTHSIDLSRFRYAPCARVIFLECT